MDANAAKSIINDYVIPIICLVGIVANIMMLVTIACGRRLQGSPYMYLITLASADLVLLVGVFGISTVRSKSCVQQKTPYEIYPYQPVSNMAANLIAFLTLAMTIERFIHVRHPLMATHLCSSGRTRKVIAFLITMAVLINFPRFFLARYISSDISNTTLFNLRCRTATEQMNMSCTPQDDSRPDKTPNLFAFSPKAKWLIWCREREMRLAYQQTFVTESAFTYTFFNVTRARIRDFCWCDDSSNCPLDNGSERRVYHKYFICVSLQYLVTNVLVGAFNCAIIYSVNRSTRYRITHLMEHTTPYLRHLQAMEQRHLTRSLLSITFMQSVTNMVYICSIPQMARFLYGDNFHEKNTYYDVHVQVSNLVIITQCSLNYILLAFNRNVRSEIRHLLRRCCSSRMPYDCFDKSTLSIYTLSSRISSSSDENFDMPKGNNNKLKNVF